MTIGTSAGACCSSTSRNILRTRPASAACFVKTTRTTPSTTNANSWPHGADYFGGAVGKGVKSIGKAVVNVATAGVKMVRKGVQVAAKVISTVVQAINPFPIEFDESKRWDLFNFNYDKAADDAEEAEKVRLLQ